MSSALNLPALRGHNASVVLGLLRGRDGVSRGELAAGSGLTPQAVSKIVARLRDEGLVAEAGRGEPTGGKPRTLLRLVPEAGLAAGVHLDRDRVAVLVADLAGRPVALREAGLRPEDPAAVADGVAAVVREAAAAAQGAGAARRAAAEGGAPLLGVGVGCPGPLDHAAGVLHRVTGLPRWDGFPLRDALAERLGLPVVLDKDTNAAVLAEPVRAGSTVYLHLGSGLGAGLVLDGALYRGARTNAGEFGHQTVQLDGPRCDCGNRGCLEVLCLAALRAGDTAGAARLLGVGAAGLVRLLDVDRVVLGGRAVLAAPDVFVRGVAAELAARVPDPAWQAVPVSVARAGERAVARGAAELVLAPLFA
ncbi:ROK family transcriptional regulator [Streptomyces sp. NPDC001380]|uniref:ROK family transcriptional regulator n=1 Tax=Streptomyces sp. NPDC001380 TaxID=3364566 RepID=UPI003694B5DF